MPKGRPNEDLIRLHVRLRRVDAEDLERFYPSFGTRTKVIRALVARHVRKLNERVGQRVSMVPDEAESHLLSEEMNVGATASPNILVGTDQPDGLSGPGVPEHPGGKAPTGSV